MLWLAVIYMLLAFALYTYAVFSGRREGLHAKHLLAFGLGLLVDWLGTYEMSVVAALTGPAPESHNLSGILSLGGMGFHFLLALAATAVRRADVVNTTFHRVSLIIYTLWVFAFVSGAAAGMGRM